MRLNTNKVNIELDLDVNEAVQLCQAIENYLLTKGLNDRNGHLRLILDYFNNKLGFTFGGNVSEDGIKKPTLENLRKVKFNLKDISEDATRNKRATDKKEYLLKDLDNIEKLVQEALKAIGPLSE